MLACFVKIVATIYDFFSQKQNNILLEFQKNKKPVNSSYVD